MDTASVCPERYTPPKYLVAPDANATDDVVDNARERPDHPAFARRVGGVWRTVSAKEFADEVEALAAGLIAAGIEPGDRVALMSATRYEIGYSSGQLRIAMDGSASALPSRAW